MNYFFQAEKVLPQGTHPRVSFHPPAKCFICQRHKHIFHDFPLGLQKVEKVMPEPNYQPYSTEGQHCEAEDVFKVCLKWWKLLRIWLLSPGPWLPGNLVLDSSFHADSHWRIRETYKRRESNELHPSKFLSHNFGLPEISSNYLHGTDGAHAKEKPIWVWLVIMKWLFIFFKGAKISRMRSNRVLQYFLK